MNKHKKCHQDKCHKPDKKEHKCHKPDKKRDDTLFFVESHSNLRQRIPNSVARLAYQGKLRFVDSPTVKWNVYQDADGSTIIRATRVQVA